MLLTVTGSGPVVTWCGETWDLGALDSGVTYEVCATTYTAPNKWTYPNTGGPSTRVYGIHGWNFFSAGNVGLNIHRDYGIARYAAGSPWYHIGGMWANVVNLQGLTYGGYGVLAYYLFYAATGQTSKPVATNGSPYMAWPSNAFTIPGTPATSLSYDILPGQRSGSYTHAGSGVTYSWAPGSGW